MIMLIQLWRDCRPTLRSVLVLALELFQGIFPPVSGPVRFHIDEFRDLKDHASLRLVEP